MKYLLMTLIMLLAFTGCQNKPNDTETQALHDAKLIEETRKKVLEEIQEKERKEKEQKDTLQQTPLKQLGINMNNGTIIIDTNKTKNFVNGLNAKIEEQMKKVSDDLQKGMVDLKDEGIQINDTKITIDLNKTKNILELWGKKIQTFAQEFDNIAKNFDINTSKGN